MFAGMIALHLWGMPALMLDSQADRFLSLNQIYMAVFMGATMVLLEGLMHPMPSWAWFGTAAVAGFCALGSRRQWFIRENQYLRDMIPHHSMAILTSRAILGKTQKPHIRELATGILDAQKNEITRMKNILQVDGGL
jgi:hypothetical protein